MVSDIQSVIINKNFFTRKEADTWIEKHGFKKTFGSKKGPDITKNYYRYRQKRPSKSYDYYMKSLDNGVDKFKSELSQLIDFLGKKSKYSGGEKKLIAGYLILLGSFISIIIILPIIRHLKNKKNNNDSNYSNQKKTNNEKHKK